jgi:hypothetical protein
MNSVHSTTCTRKHQGYPSYRYIRFTFTVPRTTNSGIQLQKIYFYINAIKVDCSTIDKKFYNTCHCNDTIHKANHNE